MDEIGVKYLVSRLLQEEREVPDFLLQAAQDQQDMCFYRVADGQLQRRFWQADDSDDTQIWHNLDRGAGVTRFMETRRTLTPVKTNAVASWYDYQDVALVEFHSKANALDSDSMHILEDALASVPGRGLKGLVVHNDAQHFSCGVNLEAVRGFFRADDYDGLDKFLDHFQQTVHKMAVADFPVVAAPVGMSIGGGFEVVLHAQQVIAHANSVTGLVETGVGLIPGGGGCKEMLYRWAAKLGSEHDNMSDAAWKVFMNLGYGVTASSPLQAKALAMLRDDDQWLMNRDRMLNVALEQITQSAEPIHHARPDIAMPGREVYHAMLEWLDKALHKGVILPHDVRVNTGLAQVITGGEIDAGTVWSEQDLYDAERRVFLELAQTAGTQARINSMLDLGQTVRN